MKTIIHVTDLAAPREEVFKALTTVEGLADWWTTKVDGDAGGDGLIDFTFGGDFNPDMRVTAFEVPSARMKTNSPSATMRWARSTTAAHTPVWIAASSPLTQSAIWGLC